tara:strand:- start:91 stop:600 length:510 start_codon:yes stop_codon:yes gene_type:complete
MANKKAYKKIKLSTTDTNTLFTKIKQIAYALNALRLGSHKEAHLNIFKARADVYKALGLEYTKKNGDTAGYLSRVAAPLADFAKVSKLSGSALFKLQSECKDLNDWTLFGISESASFKARIKTKAKTSKASGAGASNVSLHAHKDVTKGMSKKDKMDIIAMLQADIKLS